MIGAPKMLYDRGLSQVSHADLHWLDVADPVRYKLGVTVHRYVFYTCTFNTCRTTMALMRIKD